MTTALATVETDRLAKLIRLIFGSDQDGEIVAAVAAAKRLLAASDLDAHWLADRLAAPAIAGVAEERHHDDGDEHSLAWWCYHRRDALTAKERRFIDSLTRWRGPISERQAKWLHDIADRLEREVAA
jgi:hypothetical protein